MVTAGRGFLKTKKAYPRPAPTSQDPPIICAQSGARVYKIKTPAPLPPRKNTPNSQNNPGAEVSKFRTRKPSPRSNHPRHPYYLCSERGEGFRKTLAPL